MSSRTTEQQKKTKTNQPSRRLLRSCRRGVAAFKNSQPRPGTRKNKTRVPDLDTDVLRHIMLFVARSPDGARSFARALSVCKSLRELENDTELLKCVAFGERSVTEYPRSFWGINGLIVRCALAKNVDARTILLDYVEEVLHGQLLAVQRAALVVEEKGEALMAVNTRGRLRTFELAVKEFKELRDATHEESGQLLDLIRGFFKH